MEAAGISAYQNFWSHIYNFNPDSATWSLLPAEDTSAAALEPLPEFPELEARVAFSPSLLIPLRYHSFSLLIPLRYHSHSPSIPFSFPFVTILTRVSSYARLGDLKGFFFFFFHSTHVPAGVVVFAQCCQTSSVEIKDEFHEGGCFVFLTCRVNERKTTR